MVMEVYIRLKKRDDYKYGYQISPYVVFFQSSKSKEQFNEILVIKMISIIL